MIWGENMNIQIQLCGMALLFIIVLLLVGQRKINVSSQKVFNTILVCVMSSTVCNILMTLFLQVYKMQNIFFEEILTRIYMLSTIFVCALSFIYFTVELEYVIADMVRLRRAATAVMCVSVFAIIICNIEYRFDSKFGVVYLRGSAVNMAYIAAVVLVLSNFIILFRYKRYMDKRRWEAGLVWMTMWICSALVQYFNHVPTIDYAGALGVCLLFIKLENPESYLDRETGLFNEQSMKLFMKSLYKKNPNFSMITVATNESMYSSEEISGKKALLMAMKISEFFETLGAEIVVKHVGWMHTLVFENSEKMKIASEKIQKRFSLKWDADKKYTDVQVKPIIFEFPDCSIAENETQMLEYVNTFVNENIKTSTSKLLVFDGKYIDKITENNKISAMIVDAIREDRIEVFYQPIYSTKNKLYTSAEALVRIREKDGKLVMPGVFIPVAEKNGLIIELGKVVFRKACMFLKENNLTDKGIKYLEINLSAVQCVKEELAEQYIEIMEELQIDPKTINLEITESAALSSKEILLKNMNKLIEYGVEFSLDDFGTGYSNLNYILELPISIVKFDRQMTNSYFESEKGKLIMDAAINMIKAVGTKIVSEGVETKNQLEVLEKVSIDYIQGYYFSKPINGSDFLELLKEKNQ